MANYWVVRAGEDIQTEVEKRSLVGIGWAKVGDLGALSREELNQRVGEEYPDDGPNARGQSAGQLWRFAHMIKVGDIVLTPIKATRTVLIGRVTGSYRHDLKQQGHLANTRSVEWLCTGVSRDDLSVPMKNSTGGLMTVFSVSPHAEEIDGLRSEASAPPHPGPATSAGDGATAVDAAAVDTQTDAQYAEEIEARGRDRILDLLYTNFDGHGFERVVEALLTAMGFNVRGHGKGPDKGVDLVATPDALGLEQPRIKVQVKRLQDTIGRPAVQQLAGTVKQGEKGLFVSLGGFTAEARGESGSDMSLIDGDMFITLLLEHYERLSPGVKALIPLRRVYLPDVGADP